MGRSWYSRRKTYGQDKAHRKPGVAIAFSLLSTLQNEYVIWVVRRHQLGFDVPGQIAATEKLEFPEIQQEAYTGGVIGFVFGLWLVKFGVRIRLARVGNNIPARGDNAHRQRCFPGSQWKHIDRF